MTETGYAGHHVVTVAAGLKMSQLTQQSLP